MSNDFIKSALGSIASMREQSMLDMISKGDHMTIVLILRDPYSYGEALAQAAVLAAAEIIEKEHL